MSGRTPGSPRHPSSRHPRPCVLLVQLHGFSGKRMLQIGRRQDPAWRQRQSMLLSCRLQRETWRRYPFGGWQKGGFQKGGFGGCSPGTKTGTRVHSPKPPFWKPPFYLPITLFGVDKRVVSKRVVSADAPRNESRNEGTFAKTTLLRNRPFISQWPLEHVGRYVQPRDLGRNQKQVGIK